MTSPMAIEVSMMRWYSIQPTKYWFSMSLCSHLSIDSVVIPPVKSVITGLKFLLTHRGNPSDKNFLPIGLSRALSSRYSISQVCLLGVATQPNWLQTQFNVLGYPFNYFKPFICFVEFFAQQDYLCVSHSTLVQVVWRDYAPPAWDWVRPERLQRQQIE